MPSAFYNQSDVVDSCEINTRFCVSWFRGVDYIGGKLLHAAVILNAWETSVVLPIWLHDTDGILSVKFGDLILGCDVRTGRVVEYRQRCVAYGCWG